MSDDVADARHFVLRRAAELVRTFGRIKEAHEGQGAGCDGSFRALEAHYPDLVTDIEGLETALSDLRFYGGPGEVPNV